MRNSLLVILIVTAGMLYAAEKPSFETWDQYLGGADSSQYSSLKQINKSNVKQLQVAWTYEVGGTGNLLFSPIIVDSTMYVVKQGAIAALDAATGKELWTHQGAPAKGMNYWESKDRKDRRLVYITGGYITEINANTGETITSFGNNGRVDAASNSDRQVGRPGGNPGRIYENTIIVSLPGGGNYPPGTTPGDVRAFDVLTGEHKWTFHSVPRPGEFGAETWPAEYLPTSGGVHNWSEFTVDREKGIVFVPFGTARYDFYGGNRKGDNLFGNSLVALDAKTGKRLWHFQTVHHDLWDYDLPTAPKLLTIRRDGRSVDVVAQPTKQGFLFVFNRVNGVPIWPIEEKPVPQTDVPGEFTSPTQPFPSAPPPFARQSFTERDVNPFLPAAEQETIKQRLRDSRNEGLFTPPSLKGTIQMPGNNGGANWGSSAVDPTNGTMYIVSKELPMAIKLNAPAAGGGRGAGGGGRGAQREPCPFGTYTAPPRGGGAGGGAGARGAAPRGGQVAPEAGGALPPVPGAAGAAPAAGGAAAPARGGRGAGGGGGRGAGDTAPVASPLPADFVQYNAPYDFLLGTSCGLSMIGPPWSQLTAYDLNKGTILWQIPNGGVASLIEQGKPNTGAQFARGGVVVTAGGLVFVGTASDRMFRAYDKENGKVLWEYKLPAGQEGVPAVYEAGGRQYVVVPAGGDGQSPPSTPRTALGPSSYIAFALPKK